MGSPGGSGGSTGGASGTAGSIGADGGGRDGGSLYDAPIDTTPLDASACSCAIRADGVLTMSWPCFLETFGSGSPELGWCGSPGQWTSGCGLDVFTYDRSGLLQLFAYDKSGSNVGVQYENSDVAFVCPFDPTLTALKLAAGMFPASTCATSVCTCNADRTFTCPTP